LKPRFSKRASCSSPNGQASPASWNWLANREAGEGAWASFKNKSRRCRPETISTANRLGETKANLARLGSQWALPDPGQPSQDRDLNARLEQERRHWEEEHERRLAAEREELEALRKEVTSQRSTLRGLGIDVWHD